MSYKTEDIGKRAIAYDHKQGGKIINVEPHATETSPNADYVTIDTGLTLHRHYFWIEDGIFNKLFEEHKHEFFK